MEPIAIVGMACRFPGAPSLNDYWRLLSSGAEGIGPIPPDRWDVDALYDADAKAVGKMNTREGGFITEIDRFDAAFFGISPREAVQMDPQQRILLELAYEAMEDAGIAPASLAGSDTAVYIGVMSNDYLRYQTAENYHRIDVHTGGGAGFCMLANRLSYQFDLHGPSMAVDSACSSSLVTVFQACQALWTGQSALALAGGANLMLDPAFNVFYAKGGLLAPNGRCKTFGATADGIGRGEGAGLIMLKRESDALRDGDHIYAVIRGGAVNHGGRSNGVTAPNRWAQESLLRSALRHAGVRGDQLHYIELHGTGTSIGDPIEANALGKVLMEDGCTEPCLVGSVKSNIGHLEGAAGVAGLIKLALCVHHGRIPASLWYDKPNPAIDFANMPLAVNTECRAWPATAGDEPRLAGINSFGLGGTNAHLILASAPPLQQIAQSHATSSGHLLVLSARSEAALREQAQQFKTLLQGEADVAAACMTMLRRRNIHEFRLCLLGQDRQSLLQGIGDYLTARPSTQLFTGRFKMRKRAISLFVPEITTLSCNRVARWLNQAPQGRDAWQSCRELLIMRGDERLPTLAQLADAITPSDEATRTLWCFAAQYAVLQQLLATLPESLTIRTHGLAQLAAYTAAGAITLSQALDWLTQGSALHGIATAGYRVKCECDGIINPDPALINWQANAESWQMQPTEGDDALSLVVNLDGANLSLDALYCIGQHENDFGYLFARLAFLCPLQWHSMADERFVRLPSYPWQRESFWLPKPTPSVAGDQIVATVTSAPANKQIEKDPIVGSSTEMRMRLSALSAMERESELLIYLRTLVAESLRMPIEAVIADQPLNTMGIDSLTAVEIKNRVERDLRVTVSVVRFLDGYAAADFASLIASELGSAKSGATVVSNFPVAATPVAAAIKTPVITTHDIHDQVAAMSADQVNELLAQLIREAA